MTCPILLVKVTLFVNYTLFGLPNHCGLSYIVACLIPLVKVVLIVNYIPSRVLNHCVERVCDYTPWERK